MKIEISDERMALLAQTGDSKAAERLLNKYKPLVLKTGKRYYLVGGTVEDIVQEGMIGLYRAIMTYKPEKNDTFGAFAALCIKRRIHSALASANRKKHLPLNTYVSLSKPVQGDEDGKTLGETLEIQGLDPEEIFLLEERAAMTRKRLNTLLSPFEKRVLREYLKNASYDEIAHKLGVEKKSVDNALQRIKQKMNRTRG